MLNTLVHASNPGKFSLKKASATLLKGLKSALTLPFSRRVAHPKSDTTEEHNTATDFCNHPVADSSLCGASCRGTGLKQLLKRLKVQRTHAEGQEPFNSLDNRTHGSSLSTNTSRLDSVRNIQAAETYVCRSNIVEAALESQQAALGTMKDKEDVVVQKADLRADDLSHGILVPSKDTALACTATNVLGVPETAGRRAQDGYQKIWETLFQNDPVQVAGTWNGSGIWNHNGRYEAVCKQVIQEEVSLNENATPAAVSTQSTSQQKDLATAEEVGMTIDTKKIDLEGAQSKVAESDDMQQAEHCELTEVSDHSSIGTSGYTQLEDVSKVSGQETIENANGPGVSEQHKDDEALTSMEVEGGMVIDFEYSDEPEFSEVSESEPNQEHGNSEVPELDDSETSEQSETEENISDDSRINDLDYDEYKRKCELRERMYKLSMAGREVSEAMRALRSERD